MCPPRIEANSIIISQLFAGYGGYVYEMVTRYSKIVVNTFAFKGETFPADDLIRPMMDNGTYEQVENLKDGINWLRTGKSRYMNLMDQIMQLHQIAVQQGTTKIPFPKLKPVIIARTVADIPTVTKDPEYVPVNSNDQSFPYYDPNNFYNS